MLITLPDCAPGLLTDGGYNLDSDGSCGLAAGSSLPNTDPLLLPLADNGGATATHWPLFASPVRDAVPTGVNGCGTTIFYDQRGEPRPQVRAVIWGRLRLCLILRR
ncbi:MAG: choice-of-anchor Q domain-containing protein [Chloroflexota bacterium]